MRVLPQCPPRGKWNRIIVVGEAPGREEDAKGAPFVGRSGQLLDDMLAAGGIERRRCVVLNPFYSRPPRNNLAHFFAGAPYRSAVLPEFRGDLRQFHRCLTKFQPAMLLAMGRTAGWALANYTGALHARFGKIYLSDHGPVMFLYHPSYYLRGKTPEIPAQVRRIKLARLIARQLL